METHLFVDAYSDKVPVTKLRYQKTQYITRLIDEFIIPMLSKAIRSIHKLVKLTEPPQYDRRPFHRLIISVVQEKKINSEAIKRKVFPSIYFTQSLEDTCSKSIPEIRDKKATHTVMSKRPNTPEEDRGQFQLSPFEFLIVASVYICNKRGSSYGADIWEELSHSTGREYASGAVYTGLNRLLKQEFVAKQKQNDGKQHYSVTKTGLKALKQSRLDYQNLIKVSSFVEGGVV